MSDIASQELFKRVEAFKDKYSDLVDRVCEGLDGANYEYRPFDGLTGENEWGENALRASTIVRQFFNAVDADHPTVPKVDFDGLYARDVVVTTSRFSFTTPFHIHTGFVQKWLPEVRDEIKKKIDSCEDVSMRGKLAKAYTLMGKLIEGFKEDYVPLQKDLERHKKLLDKREKRENKDERNKRDGRTV